MAIGLSFFGAKTARAPQGTPTHVLPLHPVQLSAHDLDAERDRRAKASEAELQKRRKEISERGRAKPSLSDTEEALAVMMGRLAAHLGAMAEHRREYAAAMVPVERLTTAKDEASGALARAESALSALDAEERAAVEAWGATGDGDIPVPRLEERHAIEQQIADARRHCNNVSSALERQTATLAPLAANGAVLGHIRDGLVLAVLYQEAERLGHLYRAAVEDAAAIAGELDGLNKALAKFSLIPMDYMPGQPVIGRCKTPRISNVDRGNTPERRIDAPGFLLRACDGSNITAICDITDITAASQRWARYADALKGENAADDPDTLAETARLSHENAELRLRLRSSRSNLPQE